jgi:VCBS repeat-containing protein
VLVSNVANGTLTFNADGSYEYTPNADFNGTDCFVFAATDGVLTSDFATVCITVSAVNDNPVAVDNSYNTPLETPLNIAAPGILGNDSDVDGDPLTAALVSNVTQGVLSLNADGSFTYTPNSGYVGPDQFTYLANDGTNDSNVATVNINVGLSNSIPVAVADSYDVDEDATLNVPVPGVLGNDTDADLDALTAGLVSGPAHGALNLNADGSFTYTPTNNFNGSDSFVYAAADGQTNATATVTITVNPVNDVPVVQNSTPSVNEDDVLNVSAPGVLTGATDADGDPLTAILIAQGSNGVAVVNADGSYSYTPDPNFRGTDCFTFAATDGVVTSSYATVCVTVTSVDDAPVAANDAYATDEGVTLNVAAPGVLGNDTDADEDALTAVLATGPASGDLTLNPDGSFTYVPAEGFSGEVTFTYQATDGTNASNVATVTITVTPINGTPVAVNDEYVAAEDDELNVAAPGVLENDTDPNGDPLTAILVSEPANGTLTFSGNGGFDYVPDNNFNGTDSFTYQVTDGVFTSAVATVTINVSGVNGAGDIDLLAAAIDFKKKWTATDRDTLQISGRINPRGAKSNLNGATIQLMLNGVNILDPLVLDPTGSHQTKTGNVKVKARLSSVTGKYKLKFSGLDLEDVLGLPNLTQVGYTVLQVKLTINGADLDVPEIAGDFETPYSTFAGKQTLGKFKTKVNRTLTGIFQSNKTTAKLGKAGGYLVSFKGAIENENGAGLTPTDDITLRIGDEVIVVPLAAVNGKSSVPGLKKFRLAYDSRVFQITTTELEETGIPLPGVNEPTSYRLPMQLEIPTGFVTNLFETIIELKRAAGTDPKWKR